MTAEQITSITWAARRAFYATLGNTDIPDWTNLPEADQLAQVTSTQTFINNLRDGGSPVLPESYPEVYKQELSLTVAILSVFANAS